MHPSRTLSALLVTTLLPGLGGAEIRINEIMARGSERLLRWDANGVPRLGFGTPWYEASFDDGIWHTGNGPFGFGSFTNVSPAPAIGTNTATQMVNLTPTLYLRKSFTATEAQANDSSALTFDVRFNDGFVCYLNGVEVARRNAGPPNQFTYRDSFAAMGTPAHTEATTTPYLRTETVSLGVANARLVTGTNILAVHALNYWENTNLHNTTNNTLVGINNSNNFYFRGDLKLSGVTLVANNSSWKYLPGLVEPSGGFYDPALISQAKQNVPWGRPSFDDTGWPSGAAPIGAGTAPSGVTLGTNLTSQIPGKSTSLYCRTVFTATAADVADPLALQLLLDWDDGFVAYINGQEVARDRLDQANSFTPHDKVASSARSPGSYATYTLDPPGRLISEGQNVLAVQVHNVSLTDADLFMRAQLRTNPSGTNRTLVTATATWKYFIGIDEPVPPEDENIEDNPEPPDASPDWLEFHNDGPDPASLAGWRLSDDNSEPAKWTFPEGAAIPAGGYLVVFCDGLDITEPATGGFYHTNFKLDSAGERVVLSDPGGAVIDSLEFGEQTAFESFGRDANQAWVFWQLPSPGAANTGAAYSARVAPVQFSEPPGFYPTALTIQLSCNTPGATIRYTLDGTEPEITTGTEGTQVSITASKALRARAFADGMLASPVATGTYLIGESSERQSVPALCLVGHQERSLYRPFGVMAISGGAFTNFTAPTTNNGMWTQTGATPPVGAADLAAYNNVYHQGPTAERPVNLEILHADGTQGPNVEFGLRVSGSNHARPRYVLTNQNRAPGAVPGPNDDAWSATSFVQKPSFNLFFRNELGGDPLEWPLFPDYPVNAFHDLRMRAGKNDVSNPFIEDEFMRRLFINTGQHGSRGMINTLYVNGVYKGYFNLCEHIREDFLQRHYGGSNSWDVRHINSFPSGDGLAFQEMITFLRNNPQNILANYQGMKTRLDMVNFVDYLLTNIVATTGDWPHNNYICARERTNTGLHRYYVWDAEGAFGDFGGTVLTNMFTPGTTGSIVTTNPAGVGLNEGIRILYTLLRASPEFRLLFADRIQKHFFNEGCFTEDRMLAEWDAMKMEFARLIAPTPVVDRVTPWFGGIGDVSRYTTSGSTTLNLPSRRQVLFYGYTDDVAGGVFVTPHFWAEDLWPGTLAPVFSQHGGAVAPAYGLTISNPNPDGTIYYTRDGSDPRAEGGTVAGNAYTGAIVLNYPGTVKARVMSSGGVWSPLVEALFDTGIAEPLIISEIMYHPADQDATDGDEYEFLEIKNPSAEVIQLDSMRFTAGIDYCFPAGSSLAPGSHLVLAKDDDRFAERYPGVTLFGTWGASATSLANGGETLTLTNRLGRTVFRVKYSTSQPWPTTADGYGPSLVPVNPNIIPDPDNPTYWRPSTNLHGSPGADDPAPALPVYVNEVMTSSTPPAVDWVELYNPNTQSVDVSHWWISDDNSVPQKFRIPDGTIIAAGGYLVFTETDYASGAVPFAFSSAGERVRLSAGDAAGSLTGYVDSWSFGGNDRDLTFGRETNSQNIIFLVMQKQPTPAAANSGPLIGPVVLSELMYNPAAGGDEFVELRNISNAPVPLYDPANPGNTWKISGIGWTFPPGVTLQPGQIVLVTPREPATFRTKYNVPASIPIYGPCSGAQDNGGERLSLQRPGTPYLDDQGGTVVPWVDVDAVTYDDAFPWPVSPDGLGPSLERINLTAWADEPQNWRASAANGGTIGIPPATLFATWQTQVFTADELANPLVGAWTADPDADGLNNFREWAHGLDPRHPDESPVTCQTQAEGGQTYLQLRVRRSRSATGLEVFGDTSTDLGSWSLGGGVLQGSPVINGDGTETLIFRHPAPLGSSSTPQFLRGRLVAP